MRRLLAPALALLLAFGALPVPVSAADGWEVFSSDRLSAEVTSELSANPAHLALSNRTTIRTGNDLFDIVLKALGIGSYSQLASWRNGTGPSVSCPDLANRANISCASTSAGGAVLVPGSLRALLVADASAPGRIELSARPTELSIAFDVAIAAIGIALAVLAPGDCVFVDASLVVGLAWQLRPAAQGAVDALVGGDFRATYRELKALALAAANQIIDHAASWALACGLVGAFTSLHPVLLAAKLAPHAIKAAAALGHLVAVRDDPPAVVALAWGGGGVAPATPRASELETSGPTPSAATFVTESGMAMTGGCILSLRSLDAYDNLVDSYSSTSAGSKGSRSDPLAVVWNGRVETGITVPRPFEDADWQLTLDGVSIPSAGGGPVTLFGSRYWEQTHGTIPGTIDASYLISGLGKGGSFGQFYVTGWLTNDTGALRCDAEGWIEVKHSTGLVPLRCGPVDDALRSGDGIIESLPTSFDQRRVDYRQIEYPYSDLPIAALSAADVTVVRGDFPGEYSEYLPGLVRVIRVPGACDADLIGGWIDYEVAGDHGAAQYTASTEVIGDTVMAVITESSLRNIEYHVAFGDVLVTLDPYGMDDIAERTAVVGFVATMADRLGH